MQRRAGNRRKTGRGPLDRGSGIAYCIGMGGKSDTAKTGGPVADARDARLKAALKANLARRKAQAKAREAGETEGGDEDNG